MLRYLDDLQGYSLRASDGDVGSVKDFYFDDDRWVARYLVVETGTWLLSRRVLISPMSIGAPKHDDKVLPVSVTRAQVQNSPDIDTDKPVSRQHEMDYLGYYGYPTYWDSLGIWGAGSMPGMLMPEAGLASPLAPLGAGTVESNSSAAADSGGRHESADPHLRSCNEVNGYHIKAQDGEIGHVDGWLVAEQNWAIRYLVVDTSNWWMGHKVLVSPQWITDMNWADRIVTVGMTRDAIRGAPAWNVDVPPSREQEAEIHRHYDRKGYW